MLTLNRSVKTSLTIGLIQGLLLWLASTLTDPGVRVALATVVLVGGINLLLLGDNVRQRGTAWLVVGLTVVMAAISTWVFVDGDRQLFNNRWLTGQLDVLFPGDCLRLHGVHPQLANPRRALSAL